MRIGFVGDIQLGSVIEQMYGEHGDQFPFAHIKDTFDECDLVIGNMECCLVGHEKLREYQDNPFAVRGSVIDGVRDAGIHGLNLANNHILDCGADSLKETMTQADRAGVVHFGAGTDLLRASAVREVEWRGRRLAFIGACDRSSYYAKPDSAGVMPLDRRLLGKRVREAADTADLVTVSLHADLEFVRSPAPWRVRLCRWLVDQGAHLVICHHPHVVQGVEEYGGGIIAYSLGNFVFKIRGNRYQEHRPDTNWGLLLGVDVEFTPGGVRVGTECVPVEITDEHRPVRAKGTNGQLRLEEIERRGLILQDPPTLRREWRAACRREGRRELLAVYYAIRRRQFVRAMEVFRRIFFERESRRWVVGLITGGYL